jgi:hypothetical protein
VAQLQSSFLFAFMTRHAIHYDREYMDMFKRSVLTAAAVGLALGTLAAETPTHAAVGVKVGELSCHVASGWGFVFGSSRSVRCTYTGGGRVEHYVGDISKFGVDVGYTQSGVLVWDVFAPTTDLARSALAGSYGGVTASASLGVGGGANVLVGGSTKAVSLQPLSIEGNTGINAAAGIAAMSLKYQP